MLCCCLFDVLLFELFDSCFVCDLSDIPIHSILDWPVDPTRSFKIPLHSVETVKFPPKIAAQGAINPSQSR